jgi:hypothetical protein
MTYPNTTYPNTPLHIDIPVKLAEVKAVFSVADLSFVGDMPWSLGLIVRYSHRDSPGRHIDIKTRLTA